MKPLPKAALFCANLPDQFKDDELKFQLNNLFSKFGKVHHVKLNRDRQNRLGAFIQYHFTNQADLALSKSNKIYLNDRLLRVERARVNRSLRITNSTIDKLSIQSLFQKYGQIENFFIGPCGNGLNTPPEESANENEFVIRFKYRDDCMSAWFNLRQSNLFNLTWAHDFKFTNDNKKFISKGKNDENFHNQRFNDKLSSMTNSMGALDLAKSNKPINKPADDNDGDQQSQQQPPLMSSHSDSFPELKPPISNETQQSPKTPQNFIPTTPQLSTNEPPTAPSTDNHSNYPLTPPINVNNPPIKFTNKHQQQPPYFNKSPLTDKRPFHKRSNRPLNHNHQRRPFNHNQKPNIFTPQNKTQPPPQHQNPHFQSWNPSHHHAQQPFISYVPEYNQPSFIPLTTPTQNHHSYFTSPHPTFIPYPVNIGHPFMTYLPSTGPFYNQHKVNINDKPPNNPDDQPQIQGNQHNRVVAPIPVPAATGPVPPTQYKSFIPALPPTELHAMAPLRATGFMNTNAGLVPIYSPQDLERWNASNGSQSQDKNLNEKEFSNKDKDISNNNNGDQQLQPYPYIHQPIPHHLGNMQPQQHNNALGLDFSYQQNPNNNNNVCTQPQILPYEFSQQDVSHLSFEYHRRPHSDESYLHPYTIQNSQNNSNDNDDDCRQQQPSDVANFVTGPPGHTPGIRNY